jgi:ABC-type Fe3+/spermidine/putrescine transport system ATPase subunit
LGISGAGKTTCIHYLAGHEMYEDKDGVIYRILSK